MPRRPRPPRWPRSRAVHLHAAAHLRLSLDVAPRCAAVQSGVAFHSKDRSNLGYGEAGAPCRFMCKSVYMTNCTGAIANLELVSECDLSSTRLTKVRSGTLAERYYVFPMSVCVHEGAAQLDGPVCSDGTEELDTWRRAK